MFIRGGIRRGRMMMDKEICMECVATEPVTHPGGGPSSGPCPWRVGIATTDDDDELWEEGRVMCPNSGSHFIDEIPPDCLRRNKQRAYFEMALWIVREVPV
jgi:hypothetical protein